jgi:hypothetical protein
MENDDNNKKTWKDVWERLAKLEIKIDLALDNTKQVPVLCEQIRELSTDNENNKDEHKYFIRSKAFYSWIGALGTIVAIITAILSILFLFK